MILKSLEEASDKTSERRAIRIDGPSKQAEIAAALRRAFNNPVRKEDSIADEFEQLLARVH